MTTLNTTLEDAIDRAKAGQSTVLPCPAHDDQSPSLSVSPGTRQPVVMHCHTGCDPADICASVGLVWDDICNERDEDGDYGDVWTPATQHGGVTRPDMVYRYVNEQGELLYEVLRVLMPDGKKRFFQRKPDPASHHGYKWNLDGVRRVIFNLPDVIEAVANGNTVHIAEGEKCVRALEAVIPPGDVATCNSGGAEKWPHEMDEHLAGARVMIYADADDKGRAHARDVREALVELDAKVSVLEAPPGTLPGGKAVGDVADHLSIGGTIETMLVVTPEEEMERARTGFDILDIINRERTPVDFVIQGTLARNERLLLVGYEGRGKSLLCRQLGICTAAGIHPFTLNEMEPKRVLFIDAENHPHQVADSWRNLVGLAARHGKQIDPGMMTVMEEYESDRDITSDGGRAWAQERVHAYQPDLIVMGPLTNVVHHDLSDFETVNKLKRTVNALRTVCQSAIVMEHHVPLRGAVDKTRELRPYGHSVFLRWPDFGYGLKPTEDDTVYEWSRHRGDRVRGRIWPEMLRHGDPGHNSIEFPWMMSHEWE